MEEDSKLLRDLTARVVTGYLRNNTVARDALAALIEGVSQALAVPMGGQSTDMAELNPVPAVNPKRSITREHIISLEDGKPYKTLRRHLATRGMTPDQYRAKWNLPGDYPMVAAAYAERRSALAKQAGLGRKPAPPAPAKRGRPKKTT